ncbi:unnamed protein product [Closterium sp. Naga37s-1]|nr:unnamed protein product [Closterium sp. Naga37s-1]
MARFRSTTGVSSTVAAARGGQRRACSRGSRRSRGKGRAARWKGRARSRRSTRRSRSPWRRRRAWARGGAGGEDAESRRKERGGLGASPQAWLRWDLVIYHYDVDFSPALVSKGVMRTSKPLLHTPLPPILFLPLPPFLPLTPFPFLFALLPPPPGPVIYHYDVDFSPALASKGVMRAAVRQLAETYSAQLVPPGGAPSAPVRPVFDGMKNIFTARPLPFDSQEFRVVLPEKDEGAGAGRGGGGGGGGRGGTRRGTEERLLTSPTPVGRSLYSASLGSSALSSPALLAHPALSPLSPLSLSLQALDVALRERLLTSLTRWAARSTPPRWAPPRWAAGGVAAYRGFFQSALDVALRERLLTSLTPVGRSLYSASLGSTALGGGVTAYRGFFQSVRFSQQGLALNVDMAATAFHLDMPLLTFAADFLGRGGAGEAAGGAEGGGLTREPAHALTFTIEGEGETSLVAYFRSAYGYTIRHPNLPCPASDTLSAPCISLPPRLTREPAHALTFTIEGEGETSLVAYFRSAYGYTIRHPNLPCVMAGAAAARASCQWRCATSSAGSVAALDAGTPPAEAERGAAVAALDAGTPPAEAERGAGQHPAAATWEIGSMVTRNDYPNPSLASLSLACPASLRRSHSLPPSAPPTTHRCMPFGMLVHPGDDAPLSPSLPSLRRVSPPSPPPTPRPPPHAATPMPGSLACCDPYAREFGMLVHPK